jgi:hypothetical protein
LTPVPAAGFSFLACISIGNITLQLPTYGN